MCSPIERGISKRRRTIEFNRVQLLNGMPTVEHFAKELLQNVADIPIRLIRTGVAHELQKQHC